MNALKPAIRPVVACLLIGLMATGTFAADERRSLQFTSEEAITPHIPWGRPHVGGKLRVLAIVSGGYQQRELVELAQRFDLDLTSSLHFAGTGLTAMWAIGDFRLKFEELRDAINALFARDRKYDVILLSGAGWDALNEDARRQLRTWINDGTGLVWIDPRPSDPDGWKLLPVVTVKKSGTVAMSQAESHALLDALPLRVMPTVGYSTYEMKGDFAFERSLTDSGKPALVLVSELGKGRVVVLTYDARLLGRTQGGNVYDSAILPNRMAMPADAAHYPAYEHIYALVGRTLLWAAKRDAGVRLTGATVPRGANVDNVAGQQLSLAAESDAVGAATLKLIIHDVRGRVEQEFEQAVELKAGKQRIAVKLPALTAGVKVVNVLLSSDKGRLDFRAADMTVASKSRIQAVTTDKKAYTAEQTLTATAALTSDPGGDAKVRFTLIDGVGRVLQEIEQPAAGKAVAVELPMATAMGMRGHLRASLEIAGKAVDRNEVSFVISPPRVWDNFEITMWTGGAEANADHLHDARMRRFAEMGVTSVVLNENETYPAFFNAVLDNNHHICTRIGGYGKGGLMPLEESDALVDKYAEASAFWATYSPFINMAGDESYASAVGRYQKTMSEGALAGYRRWLAKEYGTIEALNQTWQSNYKSFDEPMPYTAEDLLAHTGNFAPFSDLKTYVESCFAYRYQKIQEGIARTDPHALNSASGTQSAYYLGKSHDWWRLMSNDGFRAHMGYNVGDQVRQQYSFKRIPQMQWVGYGTQGKRLTQRVINRMWEGCWGVGIFAGRLFLNPDFSWNGASRGLLAAVPHVRNGMATLLMQSHYHFDPVAVHYSQKSIHGAYTMGRSDEMERAAVGIGRNLFRAAGIESRYVATAQIEAGELDPAKFKLLLMPHSVALSAKEAEAIRKYVNAGGIVLADFAPGIMDDRVRTLEAGLLDDVFGIKRTLPTKSRFTAGEDPGASIAPPKVEAPPDTPEANMIEGDFQGIAAEVVKAIDKPLDGVFPVGQPAKLFPPVMTTVDQKPDNTRAARIVPTDAQFDPRLMRIVPANMPVTAIDATITPTTAVPLAKEQVTDVPLLLANRFGKGMAILINCDALAICGQPDRKLPAEQALAHQTMGMAMVDTIVEVAGVKPLTRLYDKHDQPNPVPAQHQLVYRQGDNLYVRPMVLPAASTPRELQLAGKAHVYEWPSGKYHGQTDRVAVRQPDNDDANDLGVGFALLGYKVTKLTMAAEAAAERGKPLGVSLALETDGKPGLHVVHVEVRRPDGSVDPRYARNVIVEAGKADCHVPFALNDDPGEWTLTARDVATGLGDQVKLTLR